MRRVRGLLNKLLSKHKLWQWAAEFLAFFDKFISMLSSKLPSTHFDSRMRIVAASDPSSRGVGTLISYLFLDKSEKMFAYATRLLKSAERNYCQVEKKAISTIFAVKRFHKMLYGCMFTLLTDHKP